MLLSYLNTQHQYPDKHVSACKLIAALDTPNPLQTIAGLASQIVFMQPNDRVYVFPRNNIRPACAVVCDDNYGAMFFEGASADLHYAGIVNGWTNFHLSRDAQGMNPYFYEAGATTVQQFNADVLRPKTIWFAFGHSFGGAAAISALDYLRRRNLAAQVKCFTYGSPRPGSGLDSTMVWTRDGLFRYFFYTDSVPLQPPHISEAGPLHYLLPRRVSINADLQAQPGQGFALGVVIQLAPRALPDIPDWGILTSLLASYSIAASPTNEVHRLTNYGLYWQRINSLPAVPNVPVVQVTPDEPVQITNRARERLLDDVAPHIPPLVPTYTPEVTFREPGAPSDPVAPRFRRRKIGKIWVVKLRDDIVDIGPTKRAAKRKAHAWSKAVPPERR